MQIKRPAASRVHLHDRLLAPDELSEALSNYVAVRPVTGHHYLALACCTSSAPKVLTRRRS
jgi:hypothetical protein